APSGESEVFFHKSWETLRPAEDYAVDAEDVGALQAFVNSMTADYAATDEKRDEAREAKLGGDLRQSRGIEVGHIFYFGEKYTKPLGFTVSGPGGEQVTPVGGSYGIGVSRLVGAIIEASHDDGGIIWPEAVAPWSVGVVTMRSDDPASAAAADMLYGKLIGSGVETLFDDRDERGGAKLASMDLIGLPWQVIVGPRGIAKGTVELKRRSTGEREELSMESAFARLTE
ncbi:MAG TPA: His/Gly/Thr/Pro-type tRNA ligase C-terminal domain-containing protein, partial [Sphingomicrobium sp.]|nr:His/Gly/Thr/Pro-type tRNA ligase C-terminal domain-containing protein [Sphingomicrobium sp.]